MSLWPILRPRFTNMRLIGLLVWRRSAPCECKSFVANITWLPSLATSTHEAGMRSYMILIFFYCSREVKVVLCTSPNIDGFNNIHLQSTPKGIGGISCDKLCVSIKIHAGYFKTL